MKLLSTMGCGRSKLANKSKADAPENETNDYYHKKSNSVGKNNIVLRGWHLFIAWEIYEVFCVGFSFILKIRNELKMAVAARFIRTVCMRRIR